MTQRLAVTGPVRYGLTLQDEGFLWYEPIQAAMDDGSN